MLTSKENWLPKSTATFIRSISVAKNRQKSKRFLVEGIKCCYELLSSDFLIDYFVIDSQRNTDELQSIISIATKKGISIFYTKSSIFITLCDTKHPQAIIAVAHQKEFEIMPNQSFVGLDNVSDPGNVGTIIRTCEWFGIKQVLFFGNCVDAFSPKVIRSSMGSIFRMKIIYLYENTELIAKFFEKIPIFIATLNANTPLTNIIPPATFGLIVGNESRGVSSILQSLDNKCCFYIAGYSNTESLNVSIATGIALYKLTEHK